MVFAGWSYKQTHTITSPSDLIDYQIKFVVYKTTGTSTDNIIYCNDHCNDDFGDIRFSANNTTFLPYYIESYTSGVSAVIWVKLPAITSATPLYIYYSNPDATSESSAGDTFEIYEEFNGTSLDATKWTSSGSPSVSDGKCTITASGSYIKSISTFSSGYALHTIVRGVNTGQTLAFGFTNNRYTSNTHYIGIYQYSTFAPRAYCQDSSTWFNQTTPITLWCDSTYHTFDILRKSGSSIDIYIDDEYSNSFTPTDFVESLYLVFEHAEGSGGTLNIETIVVRKQASVDPTHAAWIEEEENINIPTTVYQQIAIINSTVSTTDYQIQLTVYKAPGTSTGTTLYCNAKCRNDFGDLRFSIDGHTNLSYWIESYIDGISAIIWVKIPTLTANTISPLYIYYGNQTLESQSNGNTTFQFFDDFTGTSLNTNTWESEASYGTRTVNNSILNVTITSTTANTRYWNIISAKTDIRNATVITGVKLRCVSSTGLSCGCRTGIKGEGSTTGAYLTLQYNTSDLLTAQMYSGSTTAGSILATNLTRSTWYIYELYHDYISTFYAKIRNITDWIPWEINPTTQKLQIATVASNLQTSTCEYDWIYQRRYISVEPTISWSTEELGIDPPQYISVNRLNFGAEDQYEANVLINIVYPLSDFVLHYGDGSQYTSSTQTTFPTSHIYDTFGTYTIYAVGYEPTYDKTVDAYLKVSFDAPTVTASFTQNQTNNNIQFTDLSTGGIDEWYWTFGDGSTSNEQNPSHIYTTPGTYPVTLYVSNQQNYDEVSSTITIANPTPTASITTTSTDYTVPCKVSFESTTTTNDSLNEHIVLYEWSIDNEVVSNGVEFSKFFTVYNTYEVGLTVINNYGETFATSSTFTLGALPIANFKPSSYTLITSVPHTIQFTNLSTPTDIPSTYLWSFGTSNITSTAQNPSITFATLGVYNASLTTTNAYGSSNKLYSGAIKLTNKSKTLFEHVGCVDSVATIKVEVFNEATTQNDDVIMATVHDETFEMVQREIPQEAGFDEWGIPHLYQTINTLGRRIFNTINEIGSKILKNPTFDDETGLILYDAEEFTETIKFKVDHEFNK